MKWELDDNARSGFHYLVLGVLLVGLPSLLFWGFDTWHSAAVADGSLPLGIFHNGYILFDGVTTTVADTSRGERLAYACVLAVGISALTVAALLMLRSASAWLIGRWIFAVAFVWGVFSALFLPRTSATVALGALSVSQRSTLLGDITVPFTTRTTEFQWQRTDTLLGLSLPAAGVSDLFRMAAYHVHLGDTLIFATTEARSGYFGLKATATPADEALDHMDSLLFDR